MDASVELERFFELSLDLLTVAGFDGYFKRVNPAWTTHLGWTREELLATPTIELVHPEDREATLAARSRLKQGIPLTGLINRYRHKDGSYRWLDWKSISFEHNDLVYGVARDITDQRKADTERAGAQAELAVTERMASIGRLASGVAHQINNPLAYVLSNLKSALDDLDAPTALSAEQLQDVKDGLRDALEGAERIRRVVLGMASSTEAFREKRTFVNIKTVMERSLLLIGEALKRQAQLVLELQDTPAIEADESQLAEVFRTLLFDAVEPGHSSNELRVKTAAAPEGSALVELRGVTKPYSGQTLTTCERILGRCGATMVLADQGSTVRIVFAQAASD